MPYFRYTPPPEAEAPPVSVYMGVEFQADGEPSFIADDARFSVVTICEELRRHPHFEEVERVDVASTDPADWRALDKAQLDAHAEALGIKLDRRQSLAKMQAAFAEANAG